jgi:Ca2+-binding RTX toxin-like protein
MTGNGGADTFVFASVRDSKPGNGHDKIIDFSSNAGDVVDLHAIDANVDTGIDDAFTFIGASAFTGIAGQLRFVASGANSLVEGDVNGDGASDFEIFLKGVATLHAADFLL